MGCPLIGLGGNMILKIFITTWYVWSVLGILLYCIPPILGLEYEEGIQDKINAVMGILGCSLLIWGASWVVYLLW